MISLYMYVVLKIRPQMPLGATNRGPRPFPATLLANARATSEGWAQETRYLEFDITGFEAREGLECPYRAGDVALLYPENPDEEVAAFLNTAGLRGERRVQIERATVEVGSHTVPAGEGRGGMYAFYIYIYIYFLRYIEDLPWA